MKLKPCPFCGGHAVLGKATMTIVVDGKDKMGYFAYCLNCECRMPKYRKKESAIEAWNRREPTDKIVEQLEEYKNLECDDPNEDIDEEVEDAEELYDLGRSQGKLEAYLNAIEIVKGANNERN